MMQVPAGMFKMAPGDAPPREVTLAGYCIDKLEVTVKAYAACVAANACPSAPRTVKTRVKTAAEEARFSWFCNHDDRPDHPINCVDWHQAEAYCAWADKRLPTEEEWEYVARGNDGRTYPWGNDPPSAQRLNACGTECVSMLKRVMGKASSWEVMYKESDGWETTAPVGSFPAGASPFGVLDMEGNVAEWTASSSDVDRRRIVRGMGWGVFNPNDLHGVERWSPIPTERHHDLGFRCARGN